MKVLATIATAVMAFAATQAKADGFICTSESGLVVQVYNHTQPEMGTRTGAIMIVSDSNVGFGNKTIAKFTDSTGLLKSKALVYTAKVDLRYNDSSRKGELIGGTKLGELSKILLDLNFSYSHPVAHGELVKGSVTLVKRDGTVLQETANCTRYLKN